MLAYGVFEGVFICRHVVCENAERAAYSQLRLHVTDEYNRQQAGISCQNHRNVARCSVYMQRVSLVLAHVLAKVRNFEHVASKTQCVHATAFSPYTNVASKNTSVQQVKMHMKTSLIEHFPLGGVAYNSSEFLSR